MTVELDVVSLSDIRTLGSMPNGWAETVGAISGGGLHKGLMKR